MTKEKTFNFEESMEKLEKIVKSLESENQSLEKSIQLFEKGLDIVNNNFLNKYNSYDFDLKKKNIINNNNIYFLKDIDGNLSLDEFKEE